MPEPLAGAELRRILEAALMAADEPLSVRRLAAIFKPGELPAEQPRKHIREALQRLGEDAAAHGYELRQVASGYRFQVRQELSEWVSRLWEERPPRYSRALLETLALIVYKQPITRADIERTRGVAVSQSIMRTLLERGWVRVLGQREVPGRPNLYGSTRAFLDYFNLKSLNELPPLAEVEALLEPLANDALEDGAPAADEDACAAPAPDGEGSAATDGPENLANVVQLPRPLKSS